MKARVSDALLVVLVGCALVVTANSVYGTGRRPPERTRSQSPERVKGWEEFSTGGQSMGPDSASVAIVVYSDFQCPFCRKLTGTLAQVRRDYPNSVRIVYRHFPLEALHPHAFAASLASECAATQGRFQAFNDALYTSQDSIGSISWTDFARRAGVLDTALFASCLLNKDAEETIRRDIASAHKLGASGTPTVLVNEWRLRGPPTVQAIEDIVKQVLGGTER